MDIAQRDESTVILAEDEAGFFLQASNTYVWAPRGDTPVVRVHTNRDNTHLYGALNLLTGQETIMRSQNMNNETTTIYLQHIASVYPDQPILLLWDRAPHHKGPAITTFLQANPRIEIMLFPAGAPDTNPQEHVWKDTRQHVCHAHSFDTLPQVMSAVEGHLTSRSFPSTLLRDHAYSGIRARFN